MGTNPDSQKITNGMLKLNLVTKLKLNVFYNDKVAIHYIQNKVKLNFTIRVFNIVIEI